MFVRHFKRFCLTGRLIVPVREKPRCCFENVLRSVNTETGYFKQGKKSFERYASYLEKYASYHQNPLSLQQLVNFGTKTGTEVTSFEFLRFELPVRLANIMQEINHMPAILQKMPSFAMVKSMYQHSFGEILEFENSDSNNAANLNKFTETLVRIRNRHANVVETMAQGVMELKDAYGLDKADKIENQIRYFLDRFYINRISIRMLINQHALLYGSQIGNHPRHIGCIDPHCDVLEVARDAFSNARFLCEQYYLMAPDVNIECHNTCEATDSIQLVYVPSHLYHMLFELLKNSMRAVVESHMKKDKELPLLSMMICKGQEDLTIKLSDQGGGIPYSKKDMLFQYMYTTAPQPLPSHNREGSAPLVCTTSNNLAQKLKLKETLVQHLLTAESFPVLLPYAVEDLDLAGYGYGLPLSRLYARYFQGDLVVNSVEGYGTDAIIYLKVVSDEANECLPVYNKTSSKMYESDNPVSDWSSPTPWSENTSRSYSTFARHHHNHHHQQHRSQHLKT